MEILTQSWNKLVRDKVPDFIRSHGGIAETRVVEDNEEFDKLLREKDCEKGHGIKEAKDRDSLIEVIVDRYAVLDAIKSLHGITEEEVRAKRTMKNFEKGEYDKRVFLARTEGQKDG